MKKRSYQRYSAEFKQQALDLLRLGKPVPEVATELCISTNLLYANCGARTPVSRPKMTF